MKSLIQLFAFAFIALHTPAGHEVFISNDSVVLVSRGLGWCTPPTLTRVVTSDGTQCVTESADDIMKLLLAADPESKVKRSGDAPEPAAEDEE